MESEKLHVEPVRFSRPCPKSRLLLIVTSCVLVVATILAVSIGVTVAQRNARGDDPLEKARKILSEVPLVDGHNDLPWQIFNNAKNKLASFSMTDDLEVTWSNPVSKHYSQTDITRLRQGRVGAQFWAVFASCVTQKHDSIRLALEQIDVIKRFINMYPDTFQYVTSATGITDAFKNGRIGSLLGVEGGHMIDSSLAILRLMYELGVRYMTLTHNCNTPWADTLKTHTDSAKFPSKGGLTDFGKIVIKEMNRLGMMVDLSHVSHDTMRDVLDVTVSPVIFSHSSAFSLCNNYRNVPDDVIRRTQANGGIIMVNFYPGFISCQQSANITQVADHVDYIRKTCGSADCVGIGADYDGVPVTPEGLRDVSTYPNLFAELITRGWTDEDLKKLASGNIIRVLTENEQVRDKLKQEGVLPHEDWIDETATSDNTCRSPFNVAITW